MTRSLFVVCIAVMGVMLALSAPPPAAVRAGFSLQLPSTPSSGVIATVKIEDNPDINVRAGPGVDYALVGKLLAGQQVPAVGRSAGGDWVQIEYPDGPGGLAWVYSYLVNLSGSLPVVVPPATPTPLITPTVDPTLAAQFLIELAPTRLPTFTPPPPLVIPTFPLEEPAAAENTTFVYVMIGLGVIGLLGTLMSFIKVR